MAAPDTSGLSDQGLMDLIAAMRSQGGQTNPAAAGREISDQGLLDFIAKKRTEAPPETPRQTSGLDYVKGALSGAGYAARDIPYGLSQIASRYLPGSEKFDRENAAAIALYEKEKEAALEAPGAQAGYIGGQIGTAFIPGLGPMKAVAGVGKIAAAANVARAVGRPIAAGVASTALRPYETEAERGREMATAGAFGAGGSAIMGVAPAASAITRRIVKGPRGAMETIETTGERAGKISAGQKRGYNPTTGEIIDNPRLLGWEDAMEKMSGGSLYAKYRGGNKEVTNRTLSKRIGPEVPEFTSDWFSKTGAKIGQEFEEVRKLPGGFDLKDSIGSFKDAAESAGISGSSALSRSVRNFEKKYGSSMTWQQYVTQRGEWARSAVNMQDRDMARRLGEFVGILDAAAVKAAPEGGAALKAASTKYRELLMLHDAVNESGDIMAHKLYKGVEKLKGTQAFHATEPGADELVDMARYLDLTKALKSSGTAERTQAMKEVEALGSAKGITKLILARATTLSAGKALQSDWLRRVLMKEAPRTREMAGGSEAIDSLLRRGLRPVVGRSGSVGGILGPILGGQ